MEAASFFLFVERSRNEEKKDTADDLTATHRVSTSLNKTGMADTPN